MNKDHEIAHERKRNQDLRRKLWDGILATMAIEMECDYEHITPSQFRVSRDNKRVDFYPVGMKYHKIHSDKRGSLPTPEAVEKLMSATFGENARVYFEKKGGKKGLTIDSPMPIGKHKGTLIKHLPKAYLSYIYEMEYTSKEVMELLRNNEDLFM